MCRQVLVRLSRNDASATSGREVVHRQEQQVGGSQHLDRLAVGHVSVGTNEWRRELQVCLGLLPNKVDLEQRLDVRPLSNNRSIARRRYTWERVK